MIDYTSLRKSLALLQSQYTHYSTMDTDLAPYLQEALTESVIQRFEACYDCLWKVLKRYLVEELGLVNTPNSPRGVVRLAFENDLLPAGVETWFAFVDARISTSHDYSGEKAQNALSLMQGFITESIHLYESMTGDTWKILP